MFWKRATLSKEALVGQLGGICYTGTFERVMKEGSGQGASVIKLIWATIFLGPVCVRSQIWRQSWTAVKDPGSRDLVSEYGGQWACFKAYEHWHRKSSNPGTTACSMSEWLLQQFLLYPLMCFLPYILNTYTQTCACAHTQLHTSQEYAE
jgi:hypothetical protein